MKVRALLGFALVAAVVAGCANDPAAKTKFKLVRAFGTDAKGIEVKVDGSKATLTGTVSERSTQELAEEVARSVPGITSVDNEITGPSTGPIEKLRVEAVDASLEASVKSALRKSAGTEVTHAFEVEACDGVVSLRGEVASSGSGKAAVQAAEAVEGVRKVIDLIDVEGS
jgi:hyperosmotically inducible protein